MKKLLIVLICLVVVCAAGLPIANGIIMERTIKSAVEENNQKAAKIGTSPKINILEYERGLFSSRIKWRIENPGSFPGSDMMQLVLETQGTHGIFGATAQTDLKQTPKYMEWVNTHLDGKDPLSIQTQFSLTGAVSSTIHMDPFSIEEKGKKIDIHALAFDISSNNGFESMDAKGQWEGVSQGNEFVMGPMTFTSNMHQLSDMIWTGKNTISMTQFKINDGKSDPVNLSGLNFNVSTDASEDKKTLTMATDFHVDGIDLGGKQLSDWGAAFKLKQIDTAALEQGIVLYSDMMAKAGQRLEKTGGNPADFQKILKDEAAMNTTQLMSALNGLLKKGLGIEIADLDIALPEGKVAGSLNISLKKDLDASNIIMFAMQPDMLLSFFNLDAQLSLPYALAGGVPNLTQPLFPGMSTGFFVEQGDLLTLDMHIKDEKLLLNGNQVLLTQ